MVVVVVDGGLCDDRGGGRGSVGVVLVIVAVVLVVVLCVTHVCISCLNHIYVCLCSADDQTHLFLYLNPTVSAVFTFQNS